MQALAGWGEGRGAISRMALGCEEPPSEHPCAVPPPSSWDGSPLTPALSPGGRGRMHSSDRTFSSDAFDDFDGSSNDALRGALVDEWVVILGTAFLQED